ncbi:hypothetical protein K6U06_19600 [Acidiferrimicrobium sp. IK]|uniref:hypothetical protein n=1 Tax=Acidiferrimicrobium sp. IK TaxID=2871700 RepID=UPI0021CAFC42|nr:hypothetical protein [Acidiferrimicrobium sp. IK]MCU4186579.1 hypothetical protein [Acidiferrimicrobium sp. IK]
MVDVDAFYRQQLTDADRRLLGDAAGPRSALGAALASEAAETAVFGADGSGLRVGVSPFLTFAVAVHRTAATLAQATFVEERWAPRVRIPVFDVSGLRALLDDPLRRYTLVELLASYTRVVSGVAWVRSGRGWQRRRYSELDAVRLAGMLEVVTPAERPGVYRRLGDLALFTTGVFPDSPPAIGGAGKGRLLRLSGLGGAAGDLTGSALLELLGARWYQLAADAARRAGTPLTFSLEVVADLAEHFADARRILNVVTDRYLFPLRQQWFGSSQ